MFSYLEFKVTKLNFPKLLDKFSREKVSIYHIKKSERYVTFRSVLANKKKILDILNELLYNDVKFKVFGFTEIVKSHAVIFIGIILAICIAMFPKFFVFDCVVKAPSEKTKNEIEQLLKENEINPIMLNSKIDEQDLKLKVLRLEDISFAEVLTYGGKVYIYACEEVKPIKK